MNEEDTPVNGVETEVTTPEVDSGGEATEVETTNGQGEKGQATGQTYKDFDTLVKEKGWDQKTANEQLIKSYQDLERKLGNWKEVESRASEYDKLQGEYQTALEKAQAWDRAQAYIEQMEQEGQLTAGDMDMSKLSTDRLAQLWQRGVIGLADIPKERQFEVQKFVQAQETAFEEHTRSEAQRLIEKYPVMQNSKVRGLVADLIEKGMSDGKGRELSPDEVVEYVQGLLQESERVGEERIRKDTQMLKEGNLESSDSAVKTKPVVNKVTSIHDAFVAAKREMDEGV